jgi:hypothetical protein
MRSGFPPLIGSPWASADGFRRSLGYQGGTTDQGGAISDRPAHEVTMGSGLPSTHWLTMGIGGRIPPLLDAFARRVGLILIWFDFLVMHPF